MAEIVDTKDIEVVDPKNTEGIAQSLVPFYVKSYHESNKKAKYLSYLVAHFSTLEACKLAGVHHTTVMRWRENDPQFLALEKKCATERALRMSQEMLDIEFTRNFKLILERDFTILLKDAEGQVLSEKEHQYLMLIRKFYTPQQLAIIKQLASGVEGDKPFDFTKTVLEMRITREARSVK